EVNAVAHAYWEMGVRHIVALRGDPPAGAAAYAPHPQGYAWASELVFSLRSQHDFEISVATFPEGHPDARSLDAELDNLKRKIDAGATRAITQFFFDNSTYFRYVDRARKAGITVPIVPGIMPVTNFTQMTRFAAQAGRADRVTKEPFTRASRLALLEPTLEERIVILDGPRGTEIQKLRFTEAEF